MAETAPHMLDVNAHILVVDDDNELRDLVGRFLRQHGYRVTGARNGRDMRETLAGADVDLVILDIMLPAEDGLALCRELRTQSSIPILMLTAAGDDTDRILGLEMGADDYLPKPFNPRELLARIRAVLRRVSGAMGPGQLARSKTMRFAGWSLDLVRRELRSPTDIITDLSAGEYDLLLAFVEHPQRVLNREQLLDLARNRTAFPFDRSIDVQISRLRRKIEKDPSDPELIKTIRGAGYIFTPTVERN